MGYRTPQLAASKTENRFYRWHDSKTCKWTRSITVACCKLHDRGGGYVHQLIQNSDQQLLMYLKHIRFGSPYASASLLKTELVYTSYKMRLQIANKTDKQSLNTMAGYQNFGKSCRTRRRHDRAHVLLQLISKKREKMRRFINFFSG